MNNSTDIRVGLVGAGYIADWHAEALGKTPGATLTAVCDTEIGAAQALASRHGATAFDSIDDLFAAGSVDAVHILTPPPSHKDLAIKALRAGVHCLVEKPVAMSRAETDEIAQEAKQADRLFAAGHNFLGLPSYERLRAAVSSGRLGRISSAEINWHLPLAPLRSGPFGLWLLRAPKNLLLELGPHLFGFVVDLFGAVDIEYLSVGKPAALPGGDERPQSWRILARAGGVEITINLSLVEVVDDRSVILRGSSGLARLDYASDTLLIQRDNAADIVINPARRQLSLSSQMLKDGAVNATRQVTSLYRESPYALSFIGTFASFYGAISRGEPLDRRFDGASAALVMQAIDDTIAKLPPHKAPVHRQRRKPKPDVLVIGGTGFIGRALTETLVARGHDVRVLSRGRSGPFEHLPDQVEIISASLRDEAALTQAMKGVKYVYHLGKSMDATWEAALRNDVEVTEGIARSALAAGVTHFVYTGTIASYDMSDPRAVITEATGFAEDMTDRNIYARSKARCEERLTLMHKEQGLPLTIARPGIVVGKGGPLQHWGIGRWHGAGAVRVWGQGRNILPFVLIDDVADALARIIETPGAIGESVNLIGEPMLSAREYFDAIADLLGARIKVASGPLVGFHLAAEMKYALKRYGLRRKGLSRASYRDWLSRGHLSHFDNAQAKNLLGWTPQTDRDAFLREAIVEANLFGF